MPTWDRRSRGFILLLACVVGGAAPAKAQKDTGSIVGVVRDPSGAVVPKANVLITDLEHGQSSVPRPTRKGSMRPVRCGWALCGFDRDARIQEIRF